MGIGHGLREMRSLECVVEVNGQFDVLSTISFLCLNSLVMC
jgi:hypothetical protein